MTPLRLRRYVQDAPDGNDLSQLIGELVAYVVGAELEVALLTRGGGERSLPAGLTTLDLHISGVVDLLIVTTEYLGELQRHHPKELAVVRGQQDLRDLMTALIGSARMSSGNGEPGRSAECEALEVGRMRGRR